MRWPKPRLHPPELLVAASEWWACSEPERPADEAMTYDEDCHACLMKARVEFERHGDHWIDNYETVADILTRYPKSEFRRVRQERCGPIPLSLKELAHWRPFHEWAHELEER